MNAVEIEEAVSKLAEQPFDAENFPFLFLEAFGNKATTIQRLRSGASNKSDIEGGILQHNNIHIAVTKTGDVTNTLAKLRESSATRKSKAKFILATDGKEFQAEDLSSDTATIVCEYKDFADHFGYFLPLAGISTVKQIRESSFDIKATGRLNRLYVELLKDNPKWGASDRRHDMNHFMARLIFCFFAEDTNIFNQAGLFSKTIEQMSEKDSSNTHEVIEQVFRAMNTDYNERKKAKISRWAEGFPYVNGGLFSGSTEVPTFSKIARSYLLHIGNLEWKKINPDIFGSMIQAVTEDEERGALGMHYTSVPNILRVLNPLFLDDLRDKLEKAGDNARMLLNLRKRISKIRVFDPACGSGNFLVIAYKEMRAIESEINRRRNELGEPTEIKLTNFRGIELRDFPAEIARLALVIAEYQCNVLYLGQMQALAEFLPLESENWIVNGNALLVDWTMVCPVPLVAGEYETYLCGNPPYKGSQWQSEEQKKDLKIVFDKRTKKWKSLDYVSGWFLKASEYNIKASSVAAFVATNSICQGRQVDTLWSLIFADGNKINFAHTSFKWSNLASHNAGVTVIIVGFGSNSQDNKKLFSETDTGETVVKVVENINAYLVAGPNVIISQVAKPISSLNEMSFGNMPNEGGNLLLNHSEAQDAVSVHGVNERFIRPFIGSQEFIKGVDRKCIWIQSEDYSEASQNLWLTERFNAVRKQRLDSDRSTTKELANTPYRFGEVRQEGSERIIVVPSITSENRDYLPCGLLPEGTIVSNKNFALFNAPLWNMAIIASRLHWVWIGTVCVRMRTDFSYSNTLGWNTFPMPSLTEKNKEELTKCAENILLTRESFFPRTIADLYNPEKMPDELKQAHEHNDEVLERIFIGRRFKNDSERLEKLFDLYTKMIHASESAKNEKTKSTKKTKEYRNG